MTFKHLVTCDYCGHDEPAAMTGTQIEQGTFSYVQNYYHAPASWVEFRDLDFCGLSCLSAWAAREAHRES